MANKSTKLTNPTSLGLHLSAGAGDGYLTSAEYVFDETKEQSVQDSLDELREGRVLTVNGNQPDEDGNVTVTFDDPDLTGFLTKTAADELYQPVGDYLTEHQSLEGYVKSVNNTNPDESGNVTIDIPSLDGYATETWVNNQDFITSTTAAQTYQPIGNYLTEHQDLSEYATQEWVNNEGFLKEHQSLEGLVKSVNNTNPDESGNVTIDIPSIDGLITKDEADGYYQPIGDYLTEHQSLEGYATETWVGEQGYLTEHQSLEGYATETWVTEQGYLSEHQSLEDYYTKDEVDGLVAPKLGYEVVTALPTGDDIKTNIIYLKSKETSETGNIYDEYVYSNGAWELIGSTSTDMTGYATETWVTEQGYLTEHQSLDGYATETWVGEQGYLTEHQSLEGYATETWVAEQGYLTEIPEDYATKTWVGEQGYLTEHQDLSEYQKKLTFSSSDESITIDTTTTENTVDLIVKNALTDEMKEFIEELMNPSYSYSVNIVSDKETASVGDSVVFTATFSSDKEIVNSSEPVGITSVSGVTAGWTKVSDTVYTKTVNVTATTASVNSGNISGTVVNADSKSGSASAESIEVKVVKNWYIFESTAATYSAADGASVVNEFIAGTSTPLKSGVAPVSNETNTVFSVATDKDYVWFAVPSTSELITVEQLSTNVLLVDDSYNYVTTTINTSAGEYKLYRWAVSLTSGTIAAKVNIK